MFKRGESAMSTALDPLGGRCESRPHVGFICALALLALYAIPAPAQSCSEDVIGRDRAATVFIKVKKTLKVTGQVEERTGTGFVISASGYVLTSRHVVEADERVDEVQIVGAIASREAAVSPLAIIARNEHDVALLKFADTSKKYSNVSLGRPSAVKIGTPLCAISFPMQQEFYFASGTMGGEQGGFWVTQMPSNRGDSGAPVFLTSGEVVAIKVGGYDDAQNINLLVPMNLANDLLSLVPDLSDGYQHDEPDRTTANRPVCTKFNEFQGDENALALLGEKAFAQQDYECVITYLEQAKKVQASGVWKRDYPFLAAAYLLARRDMKQFKDVLQEMLAEMRLNNSYLHHGPPIGMALQNLTDVRQYLNRDGQAYIDKEVIPTAVQIKTNLHG
jgi:Trypsin-like peptidase domain